MYADSGIVWISKTTERLVMELRKSADNYGGMFLAASFALCHRSITYNLIKALVLLFICHGNVYADAPMNQWIVSKQPHGQRLWNVANGGSKYVVVGDAGIIQVSADGGQTWNTATKWPATDKVSLKGVTYGGGQFIAVGQGGAIRHSADGMSWYPSPSPAANDLHDVAYGDGKFVAVGERGTIITSVDGFTWTKLDSKLTVPLYDIVFGIDRFVAVGGVPLTPTAPDYGQGGIIISSQNGINWQANTFTDSPYGANTVIPILNSVSYGKDTFIAVGDFFTSYRSSDGINWNAIESQYSDVTARGSIYQTDLNTVDGSGAVGSAQLITEILGGGSSRPIGVGLRMFFGKSSSNMNLTIAGQVLAGTYAFPVPKWLGVAFHSNNIFISIGDFYTNYSDYSSQKPLAGIYTTESPSFIRLSIPDNSTFYKIAGDGFSLVAVGDSGTIATYNFSNFIPDVSITNLQVTKNEPFRSNEGITAAVTLQNNQTRDPDFSISIEFLDKDGNLVKVLGSEKKGGTVLNQGVPTTKNIFVTLPEITGTEVTNYKLRACIIYPTGQKIYSNLLTILMIPPSLIPDAPQNVQAVVAGYIPYQTSDSIFKISWDGYYKTSATAKIEFCNWVQRYVGIYPFGHYETQESCNGPTTFQFSTSSGNNWVYAYPISPNDTFMQNSYVKTRISIDGIDSSYAVTSPYIYHPSPTPQLQQLSILPINGGVIAIQNEIANLAFPASFNGSMGGFFDNGATITLRAVPAVGAIFDHWTGDCSGTNPVCDVIMSHGRQVGAVFKYPVNLSAINGGYISGSVNEPSGNYFNVSCGKDGDLSGCQFSVETGSTISLSGTAFKSKTWKLVDWAYVPQAARQYGTCTPYNPNCVFVINEGVFSTGVNVSPIFIPFGSELTVDSLVTPHYEITSDIGGISCGINGTICSTVLNLNQIVNLTVTPSVGYELIGWFGPCKGNPAQLKMSTDISCTPFVEPLNKSLTVLKSGSGYGDISSSSGVIQWTGKTGNLNDFYTKGATVTLTATLNGASYVEWSGCDSADGITCTIKMNSSRFVVATYHDKPIFDLDSIQVSNIGSSDNLRHIAYGNGSYVAVGANGTVLSSTDSINWTKHNSGSTAQILGVTFGRDMFVAIGVGGLITTSPDGITWTKRSEGVYANLASVTFGSGQYVAVGNNGTIITSSDGITWTTKASGLTVNLNGVVFTTDTFIAVGDNGMIASSFDATTWTARISGTTSNLADVAYGNGVLVVVGANANILTSLDNINWIARASIYPYSINAVSYGSGLFMAVDQAGKLQISTDGSLWHTTVIPINSVSLHGVVIGDNGLVSVGDNGTVVHSGLLKQLTIKFSGAGNGEISSTPPDKICGTNCLGFYSSDKSISFTATSDSNSIFAGWSGACGGTGTCTVTMDKDKSVGALFVPTVSKWPMRQHDMHNTGRADYSIPPNRLNDTFFDAVLWQKPAPGALSSSTMSYFDGAGPSGADIIVSGYHWPKGVQGMDRHTGEKFWYGNTSGGESIGVITPAFSPNGQTIYVTNDSTVGPTPLMAFKSAIGPSGYWPSGAVPSPLLTGSFSPTIAPDGRIFLPEWNQRPHAAADSGTALTEVWSADKSFFEINSRPALYQDGAILKVIAGGRSGLIKAFDGGIVGTNELWSVNAGVMIDVDPTVDPVNGHIYVSAGESSIYIIGLDASGNNLWSSSKLPVHTYAAGTNEAQRAQAAGCLSYDGATYYFQTNGSSGNGMLYAINTSDGSIKWTYNTGSKGWEMVASSPIVFFNGVIVVGNNDGGKYFALKDDGTQATLLDTLQVDSTGNARSSATVAPDGRMYLPLKTVWKVGNGDGDSPTNQVTNLFTAFDISREGGARNTLTVNLVGTGNVIPNSGTLSWNGNSGTAAYLVGDSVTLTATPAPGSTYAFTGWSGGGCSGIGTCTVVMNLAKNVTAIFSNDQELIVNITGSGAGTVTNNTQGSNPACDSFTSGSCASKFSYNAAISLLQTSNSLSTFGGWSGCGSIGVNGECNVTMTGPKSVTASFTLAPKAKIGSAGYTSLLAAYTGAGSSATILALDTEFIENLTMNGGKAIILKGGYKADYSGKSGLPSYLKGVLTIGTGSLTVEGVTIH